MTQIQFYVSIHPVNSGRVYKQFCTTWASSLWRTARQMHSEPICQCEHSQKLYTLTDGVQDFSDCTYKLRNMSIENGQTITISLVAVDEVNHVFPNFTIQTAVLNYETKDNYLVKGEQYQYTGDGYTDLIVHNFNVLGL